MRPVIFNSVHVRSEWPLFTTVAEARRKFAPGTKVMVAVGGWGDTEGFSYAAATEFGRRLWAENVRRMVEDVGADGQRLLALLSKREVANENAGVDIDWEYPG